MKELNIYAIFISKGLVNMEKEKKNIKEAARILQKLSHLLRLEISLRLLENKCCVKEIGHVLELPQATASQHLKQLREANIVKSNRKSNIVEYCITDPWIIGLLFYLKTKIESFS